MAVNNVHEGTTKILKYELLEKLPDPFLFRDGSRVKTKEDWTRRREEIYENVVDLQFGTMPPKPEFLEVEPLSYAMIETFRIRTGTRSNPVTFHMFLFKAKCAEKAPVVISGDLSFNRMFDKDMINSFTDNGINLVLFDRTELAPDIAAYNFDRFTDRDNGEYHLAAKIVEDLKTGNCGGQLKKAYPDYTFGTIGAWAWGYSRCVDALEILGCVDMDMVVFTGHSRGAKTAALAGAVDERARIVNPNAACSGGYSSYRIALDFEGLDGRMESGERLANIFHNFPAWLGQGMRDYVDDVTALPFDSHDFKAMIAPRVLFVSECSHDQWANPVGTWQTTEAAAEVFKFLGCEDNLIWNFRYGQHDQTQEDFDQLINVIQHVKDGKPLNDKFFRLPFPKMEKAYDWKCPEK